MTTALRERLTIAGKARRLSAYPRGVRHSFASWSPVLLLLAMAGCYADTRPYVDSGVGPGVDSGTPPPTDSGDVDAGPILPGDEGALRIVGDTAASGRLEVFHAGVWGTVCDDSFDEIDATVACRQLGFSSGTSYTAGGGVDPILMDDVACTGSELRLVDCSFPGWEVHNCSHGEDVGVECL